MFRGDRRNPKSGSLNYLYQVLMFYWAGEEAIGKLWFLGCCGGGCAMIQRGDTIMLNSSEGCNCLLIVLMFGMMLAFNNYFIFLLRFFVVCLLCFIVFT